MVELGLLSAEVWQRGDMQAKTTKTTMKGGPALEQVQARITADAGTGMVIKSERASAITQNTELVSAGRT